MLPAGFVYHHHDKANDSLYLLFFPSARYFRSSVRLQGAGGDWYPVSIYSGGFPTVNELVAPGLKS